MQPIITFLTDWLIISKNIDSRYLLLYIFKSFHGRYASHSGLTRQKLKDRISTGRLVWSEIQN